MRSTDTRRIGKRLLTLVGEASHHNIHALNQLDSQTKEKIYALFIYRKCIRSLKVGSRQKLGYP